jgi:hypothetical protein
MTLSTAPLCRKIDRLTHEMQSREDLELRSLGLHLLALAVEVRRSIVMRDRERLSFLLRMLSVEAKSVEGKARRVDYLDRVRSLVDAVQDTELPKVVRPAWLQASTPRFQAAS